MTSSELPPLPDELRPRAPERGATGSGRAGPRSFGGGTLWEVSTLGLEFVVYLGVALGLGWLLDFWLGTTPGFILGGAALGLLGGSWRFTRAALRAANRS